MNDSLVSAFRNKFEWIRISLEAFRRSGVVQHHLSQVHGWIRESNDDGLQVRLTQALNIRGEESIETGAN